MDEEADLALLDQHLLKTNTLSQRMTGILGQLDTRLSRLDKSIAPLGLLPLARKSANIDAALQILGGGGGSAPKAPRMVPTNGSSSNDASSSRQHEVVGGSSSASGSMSRSHSASSSATAAGPGATATAAKGYSLAPAMTPIPSAPGTGGYATPADETAIITRGPDIVSLNEFFNAMDSVVSDLERMWKGYNEGRGGAREAGIRDLSDLVEVGFTGMSQLFIKMAKEASGRALDVDHMLNSGPPTPPNYFPPLNTLLPLTKYMLSLVHPPTTPLPKTESIVRPMYGDLVRSLAHVRSEGVQRSLGVLLGRVDEIDEGGIWEGGSGRDKARGLTGLWDALIVLAEAETLLYTSLFPSLPPPELLPLTLQPALQLINSAIGATINTIKRSLASHVFVAFELFQSLIRTSQRWETAVQKCFSMTQTDPSSPEARDVLAAQMGTISTLRALAKRSFPELIVDIRTAPSSSSSGGGGGGGGQHASAISDITHTTLTYLETLPQYEKTVESLLASNQSQRSWLMGAGETPSPVRSADEEGGTVKLYVADVLGTLIIHLNQRAAGMRRPIGQTFLLNNFSHIRNTTASFNSDVIGPGAEDMLNKAFRDAKGQYMNEWQSLVGLLTSHAASTPRFVPAPGSERQQLKDASNAFFDRLAELEQACAQHPLSRQDIELRERIGRDVEDVVVRGYEAFDAKCRSKGAEKYLRNTPDELARRVQAIFR